MDNKDISEMVREMEHAFMNGGGTVTSKYVTTDLYEDINKIYAYLESKHVSGQTDALDREKPFFNISVGARNIYYRATDIDRKNINVKPTKISHDVSAFLATVALQNWMRRENYGMFLNKWGLELAGFNSAVVKHVEQEDGLHPMVIPWSRLIVDQVNFDKNPKIEILELTKQDLYKRKGYDKDMVEKLCDALQARTLTDGTKKDTLNNSIKLYEVHGELPLSYVTGKEEDKNEYVQQMHVLSFVESKNRGEYDNFTLYAGREAKDPYMLTSLIPSTDGSISLHGSVKNLFEAQWMVNHSVKSIKDQLDVASKLIFQTADQNFIGRNVLSAIEQGDILVHQVNLPLTQVNNGSHDITSQQNFATMWKQLGTEVNGVSDSMMGQVAPSGTAWRQVEALLQESHSLFELMTENKGLAIEEMLREYVLPYLKKQFDNSDEIAATLEAHGITKIDAMYVPEEAIKRYNKESVDKAISYLEGESSSIASPYDATVEEQKVRDELAPFGNQRFFVPSDIPNRTWKEVFKDLEWELEVEVTGESSDKQSMLTTLSTALQAIVNPAYANNPQAQLVIGKILSATNAISPIEMASMPPPPPAPVEPGAPLAFNTQ